MTAFPVSESLTHETPDGVKLQFRRVFARPGILDLEHRELRPDWLPHDDRWHPVSDWLLLRMQEVGSDIVRRLAAL